ncbi:MAG: hypothetical protein OJI67_08630 [Prosthecobacter sp.]|nr:hypothetical protein [Prosthecobacter sp.]
MSRPALVPFDPDLLGQVTPAEKAEPAPLMLSQVMAELDHPDNLKGVAKPLDNDAKWKLSDLAKRTYNQLHNAGQISTGETLESFRRRVSIAACGKRISQACHADRMLIQAAFLTLKGQTREAARAVVKAATTALDIAKHKLWEKVSELHLTPSYAEGISRRFYRCDIAQLTHPKQVWAVFYTIVNNANKAAGKGNDSNRWKALRAKRQTTKTTKSL